MVTSSYPSRFLRKLLCAASILCLCNPHLPLLGQDTHLRPAIAEVTSRMLAENPPPIGVNEIGDMGGTTFGKGNLIHDWGFEAASIRHRHRILDSGVENGRPWVTLDGLGVSRYNLVSSGYLSGADYRIYRLLDSSGNPLPNNPDSGYLDLSDAASYQPVASGQVPQAGTPGLPQGGWVVESYAEMRHGGFVRGSTNFTDNAFLENGTNYYYAVAAVYASGEQSFDPFESSTMAGLIELAVNPSASTSAGPFIIQNQWSGPGLDFPRMDPGNWFNFQPAPVGAISLISWQLLDASNQPISLPSGLTFDTLTGELSGAPETVWPDGTILRFRLQAANGTSTRDFIVNAPLLEAPLLGRRPPQPTNLSASPGDGFVHLSWDASSDPDVVAYRVYRSPVPNAQTRERVYLEEGADQPLRWDYIHFDTRILQPDPSWSHPRFRQGFVNDIWRPRAGSDGLTVRRVLHPVAPPGAMVHSGEACLEINATTSGPQVINGPALFYPVTGEGESRWYAFLEPGETYRYEAWMRHDGLANPVVRLTFQQMYESVGQDFSLTNDWALYTFTFTAPEPPTIDRGHSLPSIEFNGPGTVHVDNIRLFRADQESGIPGLELPDARNWAALQAFNPTTGRKGVLRNIWSGLGAYFIPDMLRLQRNSSVTFDWFQAFTPDNRPTIPFMLQFAYLTGETTEDRMVPWITINSNASIEEWEMFIEYLIEPIDPSDPAEVADKPLAYLRYQQRGVATPWIDEFRQVIVEFANETWHQQAVEAQWSGWGPTYAVGSGGREFGLYAAYITTTLENLNPRLANLRAQGRLTFNMGDNYFPYVIDGIEFVPNITAIGHATYVGPRWETGDTLNTVFDDDGVQTTLLAHAESFALDLERWRVEREQIAQEHGIWVDFQSYEGGPSGYSIDGPDDLRAIAELYGKSLAMGVASLDGWLSAYENGFTEMAFYSFTARETWASHTLHTTNYPNGYQPHTGWLAVQMRNRYASGHLVAVDFPEVPTISRGEGDIPLVSGYAFREGSRLAVFLLSRKLDGEHSGLDFGDGSTPVTLRLPANPTGPATLYRMTGDPRANNWTANNISIEELPATLQRETEINLPAGSIYLYVVDTDLDSTTAAPSAVENTSLTSQPSSSLLTWDPVPGATSYAIYRSTRPYFSRAEEEARFVSGTTSFDDPDATGGTAFFYRVAAINQWGEGLASRLSINGVNPHPPLFPAPVLGGAQVRDGALDLNWQSVPGATSYRLGYRVATSGPFNWLEVGDVETFTISGLTNGRAIQWTVQPVGPSGRGLIAPLSSATPLAANTPQPLATWSLLGATSYEVSQPASSRLSILQTSELIRGSGFIITSIEDDGSLNTTYHQLPNTFGFFPEVDQANFGRFGSGGDLQMAIDRDYFVEFSVTPEVGHRLDLTSIQTGLTYPFSEATLQVALRYRVGSGPWQDAPTGPFATPGALWTNGEIDATEVTFDLATVANLVGVEETVTFRLYVYSLEEDARFCRAGLLRRSGPALLVNGTYTAAFTPAPPQSLYQYIFGHSLINWFPHDIPLPLPPESHTSTPYWVYQFAQEAGHDYAVDGRFGFHPQYVAPDEWPPIDGWIFDGVPQRRDPADPYRFDFGTAGIDHVMFTALNFGQWRGPTEPLPWTGVDGPSVLAYSIELIDLVRETAGDLPIYVYENWPNMEFYWPEYTVGNPVPPTAANLANYYSQALGEFQDWWTELHDGLRAARPNVRSIPVGGILMRLLSETALSGITPLELYYDPAPHGTPNLYFLAAMIQYAAIYEETVPETYTPPANIHPLIASNLPLINQFIWDALNAYNAPDGTNRVFANVPAQTPAQRYATWRDTVFTAAQIALGQGAPGADPFHTGIPNWQHAIFGGTPGQEHPNRPNLTLTGTPDGEDLTLEIWVQAGLPLGIWWLETSSDLQSWSTPPTRFSIRVLETRNGLDRMEITDHHPNSPNNFYRFATNLADWE